MSTILETQVATKKLKNLQQQNGRNQRGDTGNLSVTGSASVLPADVWGSHARLVPLASHNGLDWQICYNKTSNLYQTATWLSET